MSTKARARNGSRGAILMDVTVGLAILAMAAGGIFAGFKASLNAWSTAQQFAGEQHNTRIVLDWAARRLRGMGSGYFGVPLLWAATTDVAFVGDTNGDGQIECHRIYLNADEEVVYAFSGPAPSQVASCATMTGSPLTANVEARNLTITGLDMQYFDDSQDGGAAYATLPITDPLARSAVRRIRITIQARGLQSPGAFTMSSDVHIRR
jgi:hypothetical protein